MKDFLAWSLVILMFVVGALGLGWIVQGNQFFMYKVFAPAQEQVRREVFEQSKSYRQGVIQELQSAQMEYAKASPEHKKAIATVILHRIADVPPETLPPYLNSFIAELRASKENTSDWQK